MSRTFLTASISSSPQHDTVNMNFQIHSLLVSDAEFLRRSNAIAWNGVVVDNGGLGPNGLPVGAQDQRPRFEHLTSRQSGPVS